MRLLITTLGRCEDQQTLANLPPALPRRTTLVVQEHEFEEHDRRWAGKCAGVWPLPAHVRNLGATRQFLLDHHRQLGDKYVLLDDDLTFYVRTDRDDWHLRTPTEEDMVEMFQEVEWKLDDYAHVGVSGREGNNREERYGVECVRYMRLLAYSPAKFPDWVRADRLDGMSDFDLNLQLLRAGLPSYTFYRYAQGQPGTQTAGGCSLNRTHETHDREVALMCEMHPGLVRPTLKKNRGGGDFGTRSEVEVSWKRALGWGRENRGQDGRDARAGGGTGLGDPGDGASGEDRSDEDDGRDPDSECLDGEFDDDLGGEEPVGDDDGRADERGAPAEA